MIRKFRLKENNGFGINGGVIGELLEDKGAFLRVNFPDVGGISTAEYNGTSFLPCIPEDVEELFPYTVDVKEVHSVNYCDVWAASEGEAKDIANDLQIGGEEPHMMEYDYTLDPHTWLVDKQTRIVG